MQISTKTLMHTIKHIRVLCHAKKTCSDDIKHLHESIDSKVPKILSNWQFGQSLCIWFMNITV